LVVRGIVLDRLWVPWALRAVAGALALLATIGNIVPAQAQRAPSGQFSVAQAGGRCGNCPEYYCENSGEVDRLLRQKKAEAVAKGYPPRIVALFDKIARCPGCISGQSTEVFIYVVYDQAKYRAKYGAGSSERGGVVTRNATDMPWSRQAEKQARDDLREGVAKEIQIHLGRASCICCKPTMTAAEVAELQSRNFERREGEGDWPQDRLIDPRAPGILITSVDQLGPDQDDLGEFPEAREDKTPIRDPGQLRLRKERIIHVICAACQPLADRYNDIVRDINAKLDEYAHRHRQFLVVEAALSRARNRLRAVNQTVADTARGRETKAKAQADVQALEERLKEEEQRERQVQRAIEGLRGRLAAVRKQIADCEAQCPKPRTTSSTATEDSGAVEPGLQLGLGGGVISTDGNGKHITGIDTAATPPADRRDLPSAASGGVAGLMFSYYVNPAPVAPLLLFLRSGYLRVFGGESSQSVADINTIPRGTGVVVDPPKWSVPLLVGVSVPVGKLGIHVPGLSFEVFGGGQFMRREASFNLTEVGAAGGRPIGISQAWTSFDPTVGFGFQYRLPSVGALPMTFGTSVMFDWTASRALTARSPNFPTQSYIMETGRQFDAIVLFSLGIGLSPVVVPRPAS
jgi:hypothetical protein